MLEINYGSKFKKDCNLPEQEVIVICFNRPIFFFTIKAPHLRVGLRDYWNSNNF